jgi:hypothetical protein
MIAAPEDRTLLLNAFRIFKERLDDPADGVSWLFDEMPIRTRKDAIICCTAIWAALSGLEERDIEKADPASDAGIDLHAVISMFCWNALEHSLSTGGEPPDPDATCAISPDWLNV